MNSPPLIPFNKPFIAGKELQNIAQAVAEGHIAADGHFTRLCSQFFQERFGIRHVLMTPSCTAALEMAALLCDFEPGAEVLMPSFTFVSTANAVVRCGAIPRFVDIRDDTLNIDERLLPSFINNQTRAIFPVHYAGVACEMNVIMQLAERHGLRVVEDAAQGVNAAYRGRPLGSIADLAAYSFHETKNYISGEGGALCLNDASLIERAEIIRDKGTNRKQFLCGLVDKYTWVDVGSSYVPSEIVCAFLYGQLEQIETITARRAAIFRRYQEGLADLQRKGDLQLPYVPADRTPNHHLFYIITRTFDDRSRLLKHLTERRVQAVFHYVPLHTSPMGQRWNYRAGMLPVTESLSGRLLRLPMFFGLSESDQQRVIDEIRAFFVL